MYQTLLTTDEWMYKQLLIYLLQVALIWARSYQSQTNMILEHANSRMARYVWGNLDTGIPLEFVQQRALTTF